MGGGLEGDVGGELLLLLPPFRSGRSGRSPVCGVGAVGELAASRAVSRAASRQPASRQPALACSPRRDRVVSAAASKAAPPPRVQSRRASVVGLTGLSVTLSSVRSRACQIGRWVAVSYSRAARGLAHGLRTFRLASSRGTHGGDEGAGSERRRLMVGAPRGDVGPDQADQPRDDAANPDEPVLHRRCSTGGATGAPL